MNLLNKLKSEEKGAVIVLVAIGMAAFLGFTALVTDVGQIYLTRHQLINSADAAVLAGAQELPGDSVKAKTEAEKYLAYNEPGDNYEIKVSDDNFIIEATVSKEVQLFFARALGWLDSAKLDATSAAGVGSIVGYKGIVPFGITKKQADDIVLYQEARLKAGGGDGAQGTYGALALGGSGADIYRENTKNGFEEWIRVNDVLPMESGTMNGPTVQGVTWRVDQCEHGSTCTVENPAPGCPRILMIPVYEPYGWDGQGKVKDVRIVGFAAFYASQKPTGGEIIGQFIRIVAPGEIGVGVINDYGPLAVKLIK